MVGAVVAVFLLAILYEGLKTLREYLVFMDWQHSRGHSNRSRNRSSIQRCIQSTEQDSDSEEGENERSDQSFILAKKNRVTRKKGYVLGKQRVRGKG